MHIGNPHTLLTLALLATLASAAPGRADPGVPPRTTDSAVISEPGVAADVTAKFGDFCKEWMGKLAARERDNVANIKWEHQPSGIVGAYTGYSQEHTCLLKPGTGDVPIGKIVYVETRYEKSGTSQTEAQGSAPKAIEQIEVTEIFRYKSGKWEF